MPTSLRLLGVHGKNAPTKKTLSVTPADFAIAGMIGIFERKYAVAMEVKNPSEEIDMFGGYVNANTYGKDCMKTIWDNLAGTRASVWVKSHVGNTGTAIDAVVANATVVDQAISPLSTLKLSSAYKTVLDYGAQGNRTARQITNGVRFTTTLAQNALTGDTFIYVTGLMGIRVGDIIKHTKTGPTYVYHKVTSIDESLGKVNLDTALGQAGTAGETVDVLGFKIQTFRKSITGVVQEVETRLGQTWCTMEPEVTEFYVVNVHSQNRWLKVEDLASASALNLSFPANDSAPVYNASGADGTTPTTSAHWASDLTAFDGRPVRIIANCETITISVQKAVETYCKGRDDTPVAVAVLPKDQTKSQLIALGAQYQRSDDVFMVAVADWLGISDPYTTSPTAPDRQIPNVGAVIGAWIRAINNLGVHYIPSVDQISLSGINSLINTNLGVISDSDRTDLAQFGINIIQLMSSGGFRIRNLFALSTDSATMFSNGLIMRNYIKISAENSLQSSENYPNSFGRIKSDAEAIKNFLYKLWFKGSTNSVPEGETFGQQQLPDGSLTTPDDHFEVQADAINNPISSIQAGQRNIQVYFTFPAPTGSIEIDVGIILK